VRTSVSGEIPNLKKVENMLRKDSFAPYLKFELINSDFIAMRFKYVPLSTLFGIIVFDKNEKKLEEKVSYSWTLILFFISLSIIAFIQNVIFGLLAMIVFPIVVYLSFIIVRERFKKAARLFAGY
jgi:hypothetical protein